MEGVLDAEVFVKPGDHILPVTTGPQRAGFIIAGAKTRDQALRVGIEAEAALCFEYIE
jgi:hypothetical protein